MPGHSLLLRGRDWFPFTSEQHNFYDEPERLFFMKAIFKGLPTSGYHAYKDGRAAMHIKVLSLIPVVSLEGEVLDQAETVTLFNDMCLLAPGALIDPRITWQAIDDTTAQATFAHHGISISAVLHFNTQGQLVNFVSDDRYDVNTAQQYRFSTPVRDYREFGSKLRKISCTRLLMRLPMPFPRLRSEQAPRNVMKIRQVQVLSRVAGIGYAGGKGNAPDLVIDIPLDAVDVRLLVGGKLPDGVVGVLPAA